MNDQAKALLEAVAAGAIEAVRKLVAANPPLAAVRDEHGVSAILLARYRGRADIAEVLVAAAPALDAFDATAAGDLGRLSEVIAADKGAATAFSADGFTALHLAAFFTQETAAELLIDAGADVNAVSRNAMRVCPVHSAAAVRAAAIVGLLLARGADPNRAQHSGWTPLHEASAHGDMASLETLLAHGARRDVRLDDGRTPADLARDNKAAAALARLEAA
jgi:ankyrin repeat protein